MLWPWDEDQRRDSDDVDNWIQIVLGPDTPHLLGPQGRQKIDEYLKIRTEQTSDQDTAILMHKEVKEEDGNLGNISIRFIQKIIMHCKQTGLKF